MTHQDAASRTLFGQFEDRTDRELPRSLHDYITGLTLLRAGNYSSAVDRLRHAGDDPRWPARWIVDAPLAMALYHCGRIDEARAALIRANDSLAEVASIFLDDREHQWPWFDFVEMLSFHQEATRLISGGPAEASTLIETIRERGAKKLRNYSG